MRNHYLQPQINLGPYIDPEDLADRQHESRSEIEEYCSKYNRDQLYYEKVADNYQVWHKNKVIDTFECIEDAIDLCIEILRENDL